MKISLKTGLIITGIAIVGILLVKFAANKLPLPAGVKAAANAV